MKLTLTYVLFFWDLYCDSIINSSLRKVIVVLVNHAGKADLHTLGPCKYGQWMRSFIMSLPLRAITPTHLTATHMRKAFSVTLRHCRIPHWYLAYASALQRGFSPPWLYEWGTHSIVEHVLLIELWHCGWQSMITQFSVGFLMYEWCKDDPPANW